MKTKFVLAISCLLLTATISAQVVLKSTDMLSASLNTVVTAYKGAAANVGNAGKNQTWDFNSTTLTKLGTVTFTSPTGSPMASQFPLSNYAMKYDINGDISYAYLGLNDTIFVMFYSGPSKKTYSSPKMILKFPLNYGDSVHRSDFYRKYDGFGTFKYSNKTYSNVVRIKTQFEGENPIYTWYLTSPIRPLAELEKNELVVYDDAAATSLKNETKQINIISHSSFIRIEGLDKIAQLNIIDMSGKVCLSKEISNNSQVNIEMLSKGMYVVSLTAGSEKFNYKIIK